MKILVCTSPTCIKCKGLHPVLDSIKANTGVDVEFLDLMDRSERSTSIIKEYNLQQVPFLIFYDNSGKVAVTLAGSPTESEILNVINSL